MMTKLQILILAIFLCSAAAAYTARADMYIWTDAQGIRHFSDTLPNKGVQYRKEKLESDDRPPTLDHQVEDGNGQPSKPLLPGTTTSAGKPSKQARRLEKLAQKRARLKELERRLSVHEEVLKDKQLELEKCQALLEKAQSASYQNHTAHEKRKQQWVKRVENAQRRRDKAAEKVDRLYDQISDLEIKIRRLE